MSALREISSTLANEDGGDFGFVCIWRRGTSASADDAARHGISVGDFLSDPQNQSGEWCIDGGWGAPPGPIIVRWNGEYWLNGGFNGTKFC